MTEAQFRDSFVIPFLEKLPRTSYFIKEAASVRGISDIIACVNGHFVAIELKRSKKELGKPRTKLQSYFIKKIIKANGYGLFMYPENFDDTRKILQELAKANVLSPTDC